MIWTTWRQERVAILTIGLILATGIAYMAVTGIHLNTAIVNYKDACNGQNPFSTTCIQLRGFLLGNEDGWWFEGSLAGWITGMAIAIPGVLGVMLGAPLIAREFEGKTNRIAWTQGVSRVHWFTTKLGFVGLNLVMLIAVVDVVLQWWLNIPGYGASQFGGPFGNVGWDGTFDINGVVMIAYAIFAFALGCALGALFRRTIPAVLAGFGIFAALRWYVAMHVRPYYLAPVVANYSGVRTTYFWQLAEGYVRIGTLPTLSNVAIEPNASCMKSLPGGGFEGTPNTDVCMHALGFRHVDLYQPVSRFWTFQGIESAIFLLLAAVLMVATYLVVKRRAV